MTTKAGASHQRWLLTLASFIALPCGVICQQVSPNDDDGVIGLSTSLFVLLLCISVVIVCGVVLALCTRVCGNACTCCGARGQHQPEVPVDTFRALHPIEKPHIMATPSVEDGSEPRFEYLHYTPVHPIGNVEDHDGVLYFEGEHQDNAPPPPPGQEIATTDVITVQTRNPLAGSDPNALDPLKAVYYEVAITHMSATVHRYARGDGGNPHSRMKHAVLSVGWAIRPFHPYLVVGTAPYSIGFASTGHVLVNRGGETQRFKLCAGFREGDVVGVGYERRSEAGILEFFVTLNAHRLPAIPNGAGIFVVDSVVKYHEELVANVNRSRMQGPGDMDGAGVDIQQPHAHVVIDDNLLPAAAYPTISVTGNAVLQPHLRPPHVWVPYMDLFGAQRGRPSNPRYVSQASAASTIIAQQKAKQTMYARRASAVDFASHVPTRRHGRTGRRLTPARSTVPPPLPQRRSSAAQQAEYGTNEAGLRMSRRMSAPGFLVGDAARGHRERAHALQAGTVHGKRHKFRHGHSPQIHRFGGNGIELDAPQLPGTPPARGAALREVVTTAPTPGAPVPLTFAQQVGLPKKHRRGST